MNCPACNNAMKTLDFEKQEVDLCPKCGGMWFDGSRFAAAINNLLNRNPVSLETFNEATRKKPVDADQFQQFVRKCPVCNVDMDMRNYSYDSNIFIDKCPKCDGIWTDKGEFQAAAKYVKSNPVMDNYAEALVGLSKMGRKKDSYMPQIMAAMMFSFYLWFYSLFLSMEGIVRIAVYLLVPLGCIFFNKEFRSLNGVRFCLNPFVSRITNEQAGVLITFVAWVWLCIPMVHILTSVIGMLIWG